MNHKRFASPLAAGLLLLAIPLLTGANGKGCIVGGGDVVVGGDGGGAGSSTTSGGGINCNTDSDCTIEDDSCLICADGSCAPTVCLEGTCQKSCGGQANQCSTDSDCAVQPDICEVCPDGTCGIWGCHGNACGFECPKPPAQQCTTDVDCEPVDAICIPCADGTCASMDCVNGACGWVCPAESPSCAGKDLFLKVTGDGPDEQTYSFSNCPSNAPASGDVEAYIVTHADGTQGLAIRSCSGQVAWLSLYGDAASGYPASLNNATYDYVGPDGDEHMTAAATGVHISFFGNVGEIVEGKFVVQDIPGSLDSITGYFRACRAPDAQDP